MKRELKPIPGQKMYIGKFTGTYPHREQLTDDIEIWIDSSDDWYIDALYVVDGKHICSETFPISQSNEDFVILARHDKELHQEILRMASAV